MNFLTMDHELLWHVWVVVLSLPSEQSGTKPNLVAKILATNFGVFYVI